MKYTSKEYTENWNNVFSEEAKNKQKLIEQELLEKERQFREELEKKAAIQKKKEEKLVIKTKIKKLL